MMRFINGKMTGVETLSGFDTSDYHKGNGGKLSKLVKSFRDKEVRRKDAAPVFNYADVLDLYGLSIDENGGRLDCANLIITGIWAGLALAEENRAKEKAGA